MMTRKSWLQMTTAAAICALPVLAFGQANTGGSSQQPMTTQSTPQQGSGAGYPAARDAATVGREMGPGEANSPAPGSGQGQGMQGQGRSVTNNPSGGGTGTGLMTSGGTAAAPGAPPSATGQSGGPNAGQAAQGNATQNNAGQRSDTGQRQGTQANAPGTAAGSPATGATAGSMAVDSNAVRNARRASRVIGSAVYNESNESIGEVEDILIPQAGSQPVAVLSVGGFLGIGSRLIAVPYDRLQRSSDRDRWTLQGATRDSVRSMPEFRYEGG
jgi:sporulation protein YlmC with PRC-barrel domain